MRGADYFYANKIGFEWEDFLLIHGSDIPTFFCINDRIKGQLIYSLKIILWSRQNAKHFTNKGI